MHLSTIVMVLSAAGCFKATPPFSTPAPAEMSDLETVVRQDSTDVEAVARLAAGYLSDGRGPEAREVLTAAHRSVPGDATILVALGLVEHELGFYDAAADRYEVYLEGHESLFARRIRARLDAIRNDDRRAEMQTLLASDASRSADDWESRRLDSQGLVVIPVGSPASDPELAFLATGLTWMVGRDLAAHGLDVADRAMVRSLLEVMDVGPTERLALSRGLEVGRLLGAGAVVLGEIRRAGEGRLAWTASTVTLHENGEIGVAPVFAEVEVGEVLQLEGTLVELVRRSVEGESLLPRPLTGESAPVAPPTELEALVAFGRGLGAMDDADFEAARSGFDAALALDSEFERAAELSRRAELAESIEEIPLLTTMEEAVRIGELRRAVAGLRESPGSSRQQALSRVGERDRAVVSEVLGLDRLGGSALLEIEFTPPGGGVP